MAGRQNTPAIKRDLVKHFVTAFTEIEDGTARAWVHSYINRIAQDLNGIEITNEDIDAYKAKHPNQ